MTKRQRLKLVHDVGKYVARTARHLPATPTAEMIERQTCMAHVLRADLKASGWRIVNATPFPLVCFTREGLDTANFLALLHQRQIAWMSEANVGGTRVVRACVTSFQTTEADIHRVVEQMNDLIDQTTTSPRTENE